MTIRIEHRVPQIISGPAYMWAGYQLANKEREAQEATWETQQQAASSGAIGQAVQQGTSMLGQAVFTKYGGEQAKELQLLRNQGYQGRQLLRQTGLTQPQATEYGKRLWDDRMNAQGSPMGPPQAGTPAWQPSAEETASSRGIPVDEVYSEAGYQEGRRLLGEQKRKDASMERSERRQEQQGGALIDAYFDDPTKFNPDLKIKKLIDAYRDTVTGAQASNKVSPSEARTARTIARLTLDQSATKENMRPIKPPTTMQERIKQGKREDVEYKPPKSGPKQGAGGPQVRQRVPGKEPGKVAFAPDGSLITFEEDKDGNVEVKKLGPGFALDPDKMYEQVLGAAIGKLKEGETLNYEDVAKNYAKAVTAIMAETQNLNETYRKKQDATLQTARGEDAQAMQQAALIQQQRQREQQAAQMQQKQQAQRMQQERAAAIERRRRGVAAQGAGPQLPPGPAATKFEIETAQKKILTVMKELKDRYGTADKMPLQVRQQLQALATKFNELEQQNVPASR